MSSNKFSDEFKRDAVTQITERGYPVREVSERLGVSPYSLYAWKKKFAKATSGESEKDAEIRRLKKELARVSEERDTSAGPVRNHGGHAEVAPALDGETADGRVRIPLAWPVPRAPAYFDPAIRPVGEGVGQLDRARSHIVRHHSMRRTKVAHIYKKTGNLRAVQLLLGHTKMDSTVRYLGVELDDALAIAESVEI